MARLNNLAISYELKNTRNKDALIGGITGLGIALSIHQSLWYVGSRFTAEQAREHVQKFIDPDDKLFVVNASDNTVSWCNLDSDASKEVAAFWRLNLVGEGE